MVGVPTVDYSSWGTTILQYCTNTPSRKYTLIRKRGRKWRSTSIELKGPGSTPRTTFGGCPAQKFLDLRAVFAKLCGGQRPKSNIYQSFFQSLNTIYTLSGPPVYTYPTPIFQTWSGQDSAVQLGEWEIKPGKTFSYIF